MSGTTTAIGAEPDPPAVSQLVRFLPDVVRMLAGVVRDPRVPSRAKVKASAFLALGLSPVDAVPVLGAMGLVAGISLAVRALVKHTGDEVLREHWQGTDEGYRVVMTMIDVGVRPQRLAWQLLRSRGR
jgi:uncharacterized membrane protein YkvA (DUF1232 family)